MFSSDHIEITYKKTYQHYKECFKYIASINLWTGGFYGSPWGGDPKSSLNKTKKCPYGGVWGGTKELENLNKSIYRGDIS